jgi:hypothetical protein
METSSHLISPQTNFLKTQAPLCAEEESGKIIEIKGKVMFEEERERVEHQNPEVK